MAAQVRREKSELGTPIPVEQGGYMGINTTSSSGEVLAGEAGYVKTIGKKLQMAEQAADGMGV